MNLSPCGSPLEFFDLSPVCAPKDRYGEQGLDDTSYIDVAGFRVITLKRSLYPSPSITFQTPMGVRVLESVSG